MTRQAKKKFFLTKRSAFRLPQKVVINVFSLGNPTPLANEGGIYHPHCGGRCREDSNPSAWEQFTFFSLIVPEMCDRFGEKHLSRQLLGADTTTYNGRHFNIRTDCSLPESAVFAYRVHSEIRKAIGAFSTATAFIDIPALCRLESLSKKKATEINNTV